MAEISIRKTISDLKVLYYWLLIKSRDTDIGQFLQTVPDAIELLREKEYPVPLQPHYIGAYENAEHESGFICGVECGFCHREISSTYNYCPYCGRRIKKYV